MTRVAIAPFRRISRDSGRRVRRRAAMKWFPPMVLPIGERPGGIIFRNQGGKRATIGTRDEPLDVAVPKPGLPSAARGGAGEGDGGRWIGAGSKGRDVSGV